MTDPNELDETLGGLEASMLVQKQLVAEVRNLRTSNRRLTLMAGILFVLMACTGVVGTVALNANHEAKNAAKTAAVAAQVAQEQADANQGTIRATCEATNDSRAKTVSVWETFMRIAAPNPPPDAQAKIDQLLTFVRTTYAPRDCAALTTTP